MRRWRRPEFGVWVDKGDTQIAPGQTGWETDTIAGWTAVLSARDAMLCLNTSLGRRPP